MHGHGAAGRRLLVGAAFAAALAGTLATGGCESVESQRMRARDETPGPTLQVDLCRKVSKKGKRQGVGHEFTMGRKSSVLAFAEFTDLRPGVDYTAHLVWIRPDGRESFRRFAEFSLRGSDGDWTADVLWKDALDLRDVRREELKATSPSVTLDTTLNTSADKEREPGTWRFRVYLDRRLVREEAFSLAAYREVPDGEADEAETDGRRAAGDG